MNRLRLESDIALPGHDVECIDQELTHPARRSDYLAAYSRMTGRRLSGVPGLINGFYSQHEQARYAGFKTMFNRHPRIMAFIQVPNIQFISLNRRDVHATVASFLLARAKNTWARTGGVPIESCVFKPEMRAAVARNIEYVYRSHQVLKAVKGAIRIDYEDLCDPGFASAELDAYFDRHIALLDPRPPVDPGVYIENWQTLQQFVYETWAQLEKAR